MSILIHIHNQKYFNIIFDLQTNKQTDKQIVNETRICAMTYAKSGGETLVPGLNWLQPTRRLQEGVKRSG